MGIRYNIYQDEIKDYLLCPYVHFSMELPRIFWKHYVIIMVSKINNSCEGQVTTVIPVVSPVHEASKLERFNEAFDDGTNFLNEKLTKSAKQLSSEKN